MDIEFNSYQLCLNGSASGLARDFTVETLPSQQVQTQVELEDVTLFFEAGHSPPMSGRVLVHCRNPEQEIGAVIANLGTRFDIPVPPTAGQGRLSVDVTVPLDPNGPTGDVLGRHQDHGG